MPDRAVDIRHAADFHAERVECVGGVGADIAEPLDHGGAAGLGCAELVQGVGGEEGNPVAGGAGAAVVADSLREPACAARCLSAASK